MAALEAAALSVFSHHRHSSPKFLLCRKSSPSFVNLCSSNFIPLLIHSSPASPLHTSTPKLGLLRCSTLKEVAVEKEAEEENPSTNNTKMKLFVFNLPWSFKVVDVKNLFSQCGTVTDVEILKRYNGKSRGYAFITMGAPEEAQAVIDKFDSQEVSGRVIRVEFAKRLKKPTPLPRSGPRPGETSYKLYVSNLPWKARGSHIREFISANYADSSPVSVKVVFDRSGKGRAAGYGFVSFATEEEAQAAIFALDGKELMGRPIRLKFSEAKDEESGESKEEKEDTFDSQSEVP